MKKDITELYCFVDDFVTEMEEELKKHQISNGQKDVGPNRIPWFKYWRDYDYNPYVS